VRREKKKSLLRKGTGGFTGTEGGYTSVFVGNGEKKKRSLLTFTLKRGGKKRGPRSTVKNAHYLADDGRAAYLKKRKRKGVNDTEGGVPERGGGGGEKKGHIYLNYQKEGGKDRGGKEPLVTPLKKERGTVPRKGEGRGGRGKNCHSNLAWSAKKKGERGQQKVSTKRKQGGGPKSMV